MSSVSDVWIFLTKGKLALQTPALASESSWHSGKENWLYKLIAFSFFNDDIRCRNFRLFITYMVPFLESYPQEQSLRCLSYRLQGDGLCDRRERPCKKVSVMGSGFLNSTNMTCHVKEFTVTLLTFSTFLFQCFIRCCCCWFFMAYISTYWPGDSQFMYLLVRA